MINFVFFFSLPLKAMSKLGFTPKNPCELKQNIDFCRENDFIPFLHCGTEKHVLLPLKEVNEEKIRFINLGELQVKRGL